MPFDPQAAGISRARIAWVRAAAVVVVAASLLPLWVVPYPPTVDGPLHFLNADLLRSLLNPADASLHEIYQVRAEPLPYWLLPAGLAIFLHHVPTSWLYRLTLSIVALALPLAVGRLRRRLHGSSGAITLLVFPLATGMMLQLGLLSFCLGVALALAVVAFWWSESPPGWRHSSALAALAVTLWFLHLAGWALLVLLVGAGAILQDRRLRARELWRGSLGLAATLPLAIWYLTAAAPPGGPSDLQFRPTDLLQRLAGADCLVGIASTERFEAPLFFAIVLALIAASLLQRRDRRFGARERALWAAALLFAALIALAPDRAAGGSLFTPRLAWLAFALALAAARPPRDRRVDGWVAAAACALCLARVALLVPIELKFERSRSQLADLASAVEPGERVTVAWRTDGREIWLHPGFKGDVLGTSLSWSAIEGRWTLLANQYPGRSFFPIRQIALQDASRTNNRRVNSARDFVAEYGSLPIDALLIRGLPPGWEQDPAFVSAFEVRRANDAGLLVALRSAPPAARASPL